MSQTYRMSKSDPQSRFIFIDFTHVSGLRFGLSLRPRHESSNRLILLSSCCGDLLSYLTIPDQASAAYTMLDSWEVELQWPTLGPGYWCCSSCHRSSVPPPADLALTGQGPGLWTLDLACEVLPRWAEAHGLDPLTSEVASSEALDLVGEAIILRTSLEARHPGPLTRDVVQAFTDDLLQALGEK